MPQEKRCRKRLFRSALRSAKRISKKLLKNFFRKPYIRHLFNPNSEGTKKEPPKKLTTEYPFIKHITCVDTVAEICEILGVGRASVYNLIKEGAFKAVLVDSKYRVIKASFDEWLDSDNGQEV